MDQAGGRVGSAGRVAAGPACRVNGPGGRGRLDKSVGHGRADGPGVGRPRVSDGSLGRGPNGRAGHLSRSEGVGQFDRPDARGSHGRVGRVVRIGDGRRVGLFVQSRTIAPDRAGGGRTGGSDGPGSFGRGAYGWVGQVGRTEGRLDCWTVRAGRGSDRREVWPGVRVGAGLSSDRHVGRTVSGDWIVLASGIPAGRSEGSFGRGLNARVVSCVGEFCSGLARSPITRRALYFYSGFGRSYLFGRRSNMFVVPLFEVRGQACRPNSCSFGKRLIHFGRLVRRGVFFSWFAGWFEFLVW